MARPQVAPPSHARLPCKQPNDGHGRNACIPRDPISLQASSADARSHGTNIDENLASEPSIRVLGDGDEQRPVLG